MTVTVTWTVHRFSSHHSSESETGDIRTYSLPLGDLKGTDGLYLLENWCIPCFGERVEGQFAATGGRIRASPGSLVYGDGERLERGHSRKRHGGV